MKEKRFAGKVAIVTGASKGIGYAIAAGLCGAGARVLVVSRDQSRLNECAATLGKLSGECAALAGDVYEPELAQRAVAECERRFGSVDILVNNAGVPEGMATNLAQADSLPEATYAKQMDLNHHAVRHLCRMFLPGMRERGHGRILIISSESHRLGLPMGLSHYAAAKAATLGYMRAVAAEVGRDGVTVNALSLGTMNNFEGHERAAISTLTGRAGTPEDVGAAALYLCSNEAGWMTGQTIPLNGGACTA